MSSRKNKRYLIVLICVGLVFAALWGVFGGFGNVVTNLKDKLGDSSDTDTDTDEERGDDSHRDGSLLFLFRNLV